MVEPLLPSGYSSTTFSSASERLDKHGYTPALLEGSNGSKAHVDEVKEEYSIMSRTVGQHAPKDVKDLDTPSKTHTKLEVSNLMSHESISTSSEIPLGLSPARVQVLEHPLRHPLTLAAESHTEDARQSGEDNDEHDTLGPLRAEGPAMGLRLGSGSKSLRIGRSKVPQSSAHHVRHRSHSERLLRSDGSDERRNNSERSSARLTAATACGVFPPEVSLAERRKYEEELIKRFDRVIVNSHVREFWHLIDAIWMNQWIDFIMGRGDPPGRISNGNLYEKVNEHLPAARREPMLATRLAMTRSSGRALANEPSLRFKNGMRKLRDYRAIHPVVWYLFREMYGTDNTPEICRWNPDIYSGEVVASRKIRLESESRNQAVYELRKFVTKITEDVLKRKEAEEMAAEAQQEED